jgi:general secretion pathway protein G
MMVVIAVILIIASIAPPVYRAAVVRAREAVLRRVPDGTRLREDLYTLRFLIDRFTVDNGRSPVHLDEIVEKGYLGRLPTDPFSSRE